MNINEWKNTCTAGYCKPSAIFPSDIDANKEMSREDYDERTDGKQDYFKDGIADIDI
jgi:hypothetical protein